MSYGTQEQSAYKQMMGDVINHGFLAVSMVMGRRTGLFDVLLKADKALTVPEVASRAGLKERYVREWLGCMASSGVIEVDQEGAEYFIPPEKAKVLQPMLRVVGYLSCAMDRFGDIQQCFSKEGPAGKSFGSTGGVLQMLTVEETGAADPTIDEDFLKSVPELKRKLESGIEVAEFGSNAGMILSALAQRFPKSRFRGSDIDEGAVREAQERVQALGLKNVSFHVVDLCRLPQDWVASFHWVFVRDVIHDLPHPEVGVKGIHQSLKEGGLCSVLDINARTRHQDNVGKPMMGLMFTMSTFFCVPNALHQDAESVALGALWGVDQARELWTKCGFQILHDGPSNYDPLFRHYVLQK